MELLLKYYHLKALLSCDLQFMIEVLANEFGPDFTLRFEEMTDAEKMEASSQLGAMEEGIPVRGIDQRFWLALLGEDGSARRLEALEKHIVQKGQK